jgi:hypothetical protein
MGIVIGSNFDMAAQLPLDSRTKVANGTARDAIPSGVRYEGLIVYSVADATNYQLVGGITNGDWKELSGGGGAGGFTPQWNNDTNAPLFSVVNGVPRWDFDQAAVQSLYCLIKVPNGYAGAKPITMRSFFTNQDSSTNNVLFQTLTTLIKPGTDLLSSTTNQRTSTNTAKVQSPTLTGKIQVVVNDLTDTSGNINGVAVTPGDTLLVTFFRNASDTSLVASSFLPTSTEVTFS